MIALVVDAKLQIVEARHGDVEMSLSTRRIAVAWALIVYPNYHLTTSGSSQENAISTTEEVVAGGRGSIH